MKGIKQKLYELNTIVFFTEMFASDFIPLSYLYVAN